MLLTVVIGAHSDQVDESMRPSQFTVKGVALYTTLCREGKCETSKSSDEVVYEVDLSEETFTRKAVVNSGKGVLSGLQADNTKYMIVFYGRSLLLFDKSEKLMKGFGGSSMYGSTRAVQVSGSPGIEEPLNGRLSATRCGWESPMHL